MRIIHDLSPNFALNNDIRGLGWSNGSLTLQAKDIEALYHSNLYLNVLTTNGGSGNVAVEEKDALRCRIMPHILNSAHELSSSPILLTSDPPSKTAVTGIAWTNVDSTCRINYDVRLEGMNDQNINSQLILEDYPIR